MARATIESTVFAKKNRSVSVEKNKVDGLYLSSVICIYYKLVLWLYWQEAQLNISWCV